MALLRAYRNADKRSPLKGGEFTGWRYYVLAAMPIKNSPLKGGEFTGWRYYVLAAMPINAPPLLKGEGVGG